MSDSTYGNTMMLFKDALIAIAHPQTGESVNVFRADDYSEANPVYLVKGTDASGKTYEQTINVNEVNPENCSYTELLALNAHTGHNKDSDFLSMGRMRDTVGGKSIFEQCNYMAGAESLMNEQKTLGNWEGYLKYQKWMQDMFDFMDTTKDKKSTDKEEKAQTKSDIIVNADGSRNLMLETMLGGIKSVMNIQLSKPTDRMNQSQKTESEEDAVCRWETAMEVQS